MYNTGIKGIFLSSLLVLAACGGTGTPAISSPQSMTGITTKAAKTTPEGFFTLTAALTVPDVDAAIAYYADAFGAVKRYTLPGPDGKPMHAEIKVGDSILMLNPENPQWGSKSPKTLGGTPGALTLYVKDADATIQAAVAAGATIMMPVADQFWGDRYGMVVDPFGHRWGIATHKEELTNEQLVKRATLLDPKTGQLAGPVPPGKPAKNYIADGYHSITPGLTVKNAVAMIEFYKNALGAKEVTRLPMPDGRLMYAEVSIGDSILAFHDEMPEMGSKSPASMGGTPVSLMMYVDDVDAAYKQAIEAGATSKSPPRDMFWGDRFAEVVDPSGHRWGIATHKEDLTPEQVMQRMQSEFAKTPH